MAKVEIAYPPRLMNAEIAADYLGIPVDVVPFLPVERVILEEYPLYDRLTLNGLTGSEIRAAHTRKDLHERSQKGWVRETVPAAVARTVYERDGEVCAYCGTNEGPFHLDHIQPVSKGGKNTAENLTVACNSCNSSKGSKTVEEWQSRDMFRTKRGRKNA